jgi:hypothetical protein
MTKEELAKSLNGMEYGKDIPDNLLKSAKENNLIIIYGSSDDLMELEGAIRDEGGCYCGEEFMIDREGLLPDRDQIEEDDELEEYFKRKKSAKKITAIWCAEGEPAWTYKTTIPHATFEVIEGNGDLEVQCRGIVFSLDDL